MNLDPASSTADSFQRITALTFTIYLVVTGGMTVLAGSEIPNRTFLVALHTVAVGLIAVLTRLPLRAGSAFAFLRDWYPFATFPALYKEVAVLARIYGDWSLTHLIISFEQRLFGQLPSTYFSERFANVILSEWLHFSYLSYLALLPAVGGIWYFRGRLHPFRELVCLATLAFCLSYLFFIWLPVDTPFYLSKPPGPPLEGQLFYDLVHEVASRGGARGGAFPSTHVSISTIAMLLALRYSRRLAFLILPIYIGICLGTVYGRFHYISDVLAGIALAVLLVLALRLAERAGRLNCQS